MGENAANRPVTATLRFHAELNDLLRPDRRQRDIPVSFPVGPTLKDVIEGLGVPHTEIGVVLVDGERADLARRVAGGERVSVYPPSRPLDVAAAPHDGGRFVVDVHLGALARYLRLLGFDTVFDSEATDDDLARRSVDEHRVLLTRDRGLLKRRAVTRGVLVRADDPDEQLVEVVRRLDLAGRVDPFTRCMRCNGQLVDVDKETVADRLEPRTRATFDRFRECAACRRVYWQGAHHARLARLVERARSAGDR